MPHLLPGIKLRRVNICCVDAKNVIPPSKTNFPWKLYKLYSLL